jgi:hypothetical protein
MAKKSKAGRQVAAERKPEAAVPASPLAKARWAMEAGDVRRAGVLAEEAARSGPEEERAEAQKLLARLRPDPVAILVASLVLLAIVLAAWAALLHAH